MKKITKLKSETKSKRLGKKHMNEEELLSTQKEKSEKVRAPLYKKNVLVLASGGVLLILIIILTLVAILLPSGKKSQNTNNLGQAVPGVGREQPVVLLTPTPTPMPTSTPTPTPFPLPKGPQRYSVSAKNAVIIVKELYISALDTKIGDSQTMSLTLQDPKGAVNSVVIKLVTDKKSETHVLSLKSGTGSDGVWEATWKTDDTHDFIYQAQITIKDGSGNSFSGTPSFR